MPHRLSLTFFLSRRPVGGGALCEALCPLPNSRQMDPDAGPSASTRWAATLAEVRRQARLHFASTAGADGWFDVGEGGVVGDRDGAGGGGDPWRQEEWHVAFEVVVSVC